MAHGPWTSAHLSIHLPQSFCLNSSAKLWENLVYQSAFVTIKRRLKLRGGGVGLPVVSVKVVIMQKPPKRRKKWKWGKLLPRWRCHRHWRHGTEVLSPAVHLLFWQPRLLGHHFFFFFVFWPSSFCFLWQSIMMAGNVSFWSASPWNMQRAVKKLFICINQTELFLPPLHRTARTFDNNGSNCIINRCKKRLVRGQGAVIVSTFLTIIARAFFNDFCSLGWAEPKAAMTN